MVDQPSEEDLRSARDGFWRDVERALRGKGVSRDTAGRVTREFRESLKQKELEDWALHDGVTSVAERLLAQTQDRGMERGMVT